jgi:hypothetical protein
VGVADLGDSGHVDGVVDAPVAAQRQPVDFAVPGGHLDRGGAFTAAKEFWTVPTVKTGSGNQYSADWVGIDGFSNAKLVQDGTEADNVGGRAIYRAWTEILPAPEVVISGLAIHPGDRIEGLVQEVSANRWQMTVFDLTTGQSGGRTVSYAAAGTSVEAIHERPVVNGSLAALAKTGPVTFDPGSYSTAAPGSVPSFKPLLSAASGATLNEIFMVNNAGTKVIASPRPSTAIATGSRSPTVPLHHRHLAVRQAPAVTSRPAAARVSQLCRR